MTGREGAPAGHTRPDNVCPGCGHLRESHRLVGGIRPFRGGCTKCRCDLFGPPHTRPDEQAVAEPWATLREIAEEGCSRFDQPGDRTCRYWLDRSVWCGCCIARAALAGARPAAEPDVMVGDVGAAKRIAQGLRERVTDADARDRVDSLIGYLDDLAARPAGDGASTLHHTDPRHVEWLVHDLHGRLTTLLHERSELEKRLAERDAELDRARSDAAALRDAGNESDDVLGAMLRELAPIPWGLHEDATAARDRWRSAAASPATDEQENRDV